MEHNDYLQALSSLGVGGAHPGGLKLTKHMLKKANIKPTMTILDAGCGTGLTAAYLAGEYGCRVTALDNDQMMLAKAKERFTSLKLPTNTKLGSTEDLPFAAASFDMVIAESVIIFTNIVKTIAEFKRVLKPAGLLYAVEMVLEEKQLTEQEEKEVKQFYGVHKLLTESEWEKQFQDVGVKVLSIEKFSAETDDQDIENAQDFSPSREKIDKYMNVMHQHFYLTNLYKESLGFRIFKCSL